MQRPSAGKRNSDVVDANLTNNNNFYTDKDPLISSNIGANVIIIPPTNERRKGGAPLMGIPLYQHNRKFNKINDNNLCDNKDEDDNISGNVNVESSNLLPPSPTSVLKDRIVVQGYKDVWAAVLFIICNTYVIISATMTMVQLNNGKLKVPPEMVSIAFYNPSSNVSTDVDKINENVSFWSFFFQMFILVLLIWFASLVFYLFIRAPQSAIVISTVTMSAWFFVMSLYTLFTPGSVLIGLCTLFLSVVNIGFLYLWRHRIPFAAVLLKSATVVAASYGALFLTSISIAALFSAYLTTWSLMMLPAAVRQFNAVQQASAPSPPPHYHGGPEGRQTAPPSLRNEPSGTIFTAQAGDAFLSVFGLLMLYWTSQVLYNVGHVVTCGVTATWYFVGGSVTKMPPNPTLYSVKRACTTSFGSVCLGSLLVALIDLARAIAQHYRASAAEDGDNSLTTYFIWCLIDCVLSCLAAIVEYFNRYAFVYVAMYGYGYLEAARRTKELAKSNFFDANFNDTVVSFTLLNNSLGPSIIIGFLMWLLYRSLPIALSSFAISLFIFLQLLKIIDSALVTLYVCFVEEPAALAQTNPELFMNIQTTDIHYGEQL